MNFSFCDINSKAAQLIGGGLRGNRNLQRLNLKGNPIKEGIIEITKSFVENTNSLCIKEFDISKCSLESDHITREFIDMIKSPFCTLKMVSLRDNFIKQPSAELIKEALKVNRTITKIHLDYNPIKKKCIE